MISKAVIDVGPECEMPWESILLHRLVTGSAKARITGKYSRDSIANVTLLLMEGRVDTQGGPKVPSQQWGRHHLRKAYWHGLQSNCGSRISGETESVDKFIKKMQCIAYCRKRKSRFCVLFDGSRSHTWRMVHLFLKLLFPERWTRCRSQTVTLMHFVGGNISKKY